MEKPKQLNKRGQMTEAIDELVGRSKDHPELRRFRRFHASHPEVLDFLVTEILLLIAHGRTAFSFHSLWNYCRWKLEMRALPGESYAMNDHMGPYFARAVTILYPEFNGFAEFRESVSDTLFGTRLEPFKKDGHRARRRLQWADGTPLELGWRPAHPHVVVKPAHTKDDIHERSAR